MTQRFSISPSAAAMDKGLPDSIFRTLACLGIFGDKNGWCWPALASIAAMRGVSKERISMDIKALVEAGYVRRQARYDNNRQISNKYQVLFDAPLTPVINGGLTAGINQNAPINAPINDDDDDSRKFIKICEMYQAEVGLLTPMIADALKDSSGIYPLEWFSAAFKIASENNARKWRYIEACLKNMQIHGFGWKPEKHSARGTKKAAFGQAIDELGEWVRE